MFESISRQRERSRMGKNLAFGARSDHETTTPPKKNSKNLGEGTGYFYKTREVLGGWEIPAETWLIAVHEPLPCELPQDEALPFNSCH